MAERGQPEHNLQRLEALLDAQHPCISIVTSEEAYALELIKSAVMHSGHRLLLWSATRGVHGGLLEDAPGVAQTEHPAAALFHFAHQLEIKALCVTLDLAAHLDEPRRIFEIHLAKRNRKPEEFDLDALAEASEGYSGAEIEQAIIAALHDAFAKRDGLTTGHLRKALAASPPLSVTMAERVAWIREWSRTRCVPAD